MAQRDTATFQIARANELSKLIDAAIERPTKELSEFHICITWLQKYGRPVEIDEVVRFPQNW